jgi:hypothetical protein
MPKVEEKKDEAPIHAEIKQENKTEPIPESKPEPILESKPEPIPEIKSEPSLESKPETKADPIAENKSLHQQGGGSQKILQRAIKGQQEVASLLNDLKTNIEAPAAPI